MFQQKPCYCHLAIGYCGSRGLQTGRKFWDPVGAGACFSKSMFLEDQLWFVRDKMFYDEKVAGFARQ